MKIPKEKCPNISAGDISSEVTEMSTNTMDFYTSEHVFDAGNYEEGLDLTGYTVFDGRKEEIHENAYPTYCKGTGGMTIKQRLDRMESIFIAENAKKDAILASHAQEIASQAKEISRLQAVKGEDFVRTAVEIGLAIQDHVISAFVASNARPLIKESSYFEFLHPVDRDAIEKTDLYKKAAVVLGDDFSSIVDYHNSQAHPRRLVHEAEEVALSLLHGGNIAVEYDQELLSKAMRTFDRMKTFDGINNIILNYRKKMKDKRKYNKTLSQ